MLKSRVTSFALVLIASICGGAHAGPGVWTTGGPYGGSTWALAIDPTSSSTLYAGTPGNGIFKSTDAGASWARSATGQASVYVLALAIDPVTPARIYAGVSGGVGAIRSSDAGGSWVAVGPANTTVATLAIDPTTPTTLYAGAGYDGIFRSTDAGGTWVSVSTGIGPLDVVDIAIDPNTPTTLYAANGYRGEVWKSTNSGGTWALAYTGPFSSSVSAIAVDPLNPTMVFAGTSLLINGIYEAGVFKSTDAGGTWVPASVGLAGYGVRSLAIDPTTVTTMYAGTYLGDGGVFKSTDSGATWVDTLSLSISKLAINPSAPATIYAASDVGVFRSTNSGGIWGPTNAGLTNLQVNALAIDPTTPTTLYAGATSYDRTYGALPGGIFKSTNSGGTWAVVNTGLTFPYVTAVAINPALPSELYAGTTSALFKSTDAGGSWAMSLGFSRVAAVAIDPTAPSTVYVGVGDVYKTTDSGGTWAGASVGPSGTEVRAIAINPTASTILYAGTYGGAGVYKSTNSGATWTPASAGLGHSVYALAIDPLTPTTIYAGTLGDGVYKSTNSGGTWSPANEGIALRVINALAIDSETPSTLYAGASARGEFPVGPGGAVFRSTNSGGTWSSVNAGLAPTPAIYALALDAAGPGTIYAGLSGGGVWQAGLPPPPSFAKGDFNTDGLADMVFRSNANGAQNKVWFMDGVTRTAEAVITPDAASADWKIRGVDDFNADGRNDLVFWNQTTGNVEFWLMNGTARVGTPVALTGGPVLDPGWDLSATADFNHDGSPDIVWRNFASQKIVVWTMNGTNKNGTLIPTPSQAVDANWIIVAALDYNDDGNTDFLWYNFTSGKLVTWYMDASVVRATGQFTTPSAAGDANWKVVASSDYSREYVPGTPPLGSPDIVWRNETSGNQVIWHMDFGSTRVHGQFTNPAANTPALDWTIVGPR